MNLSFRPATIIDAPVIEESARRIWQAHYPSIITLEQIDYMLTTRNSAQAIAAAINGGEQYFLAYSYNEPIGFASLAEREHDYFLNKFYVDVNRHRTGIGSLFFAFLLNEMDGNKPIRLQVNRQNIKAINFYFKSGFVIESTGDFDIGNGYQMNDFVMVRPSTNSGWQELLNSWPACRTSARYSGQHCAVR